MKRYLFILAAILGLSPEAHAANSTVAAMTPAGSLTGTELVYVVQGGADRKATPAQFATYMQGLITGDCSISGNTITCTKTNGVSFAPSATIDTTNASNISSGTLNTARLPSPFTSGTRSGNTSVFGTVTGTPTSGNCANWDASGNLADAGAACGTGGSSTITAGTTATSGITTNTFITSTSNVVTNTAKAIPSGVVVGTTDTQTLTNKSISGAQINSGTLADAQLTSNVPLKNGSNAFTSANSFSGSTTWTGNLITPIRTVTAAGAITVSATTDYFICVNKTVGAATTVNLPASPTTGLTFLIKDCKGDAATNNITITPNAGNIDNTPTFVINVNLQSVAITYSGVGWWVN